MGEEVAQRVKLCIRRSSPSCKTNKKGVSIKWKEMKGVESEMVVVVKEVMEEGGEGGKGWEYKTREIGEGRVRGSGGRRSTWRSGWNGGRRESRKNEEVLACLHITT